LEEEADSIDLGFEEYKRAMGIFRDKELPNKDPQDLHWREQQILAQRKFDDGNTIQAVIILHGLIEIELNRILIMVLLCKITTNDAEIENFKERNYKELVAYFEEEKILEEDMIRNLKEFNQFRNSLSHNLYGAKQRTTHKTEMKNKFELGLLASGELPLLEFKYLYDQKREGNDIAKRLIKFIEKEGEKDMKEKYGEDYEDRLS